MTLAETANFSLSLIFAYSYSPKSSGRKSSVIRYSTAAFCISSSSSLTISRQALCPAYRIPAKIW